MNSKAYCTCVNKHQRIRQELIRVLNNKIPTKPYQYLTLVDIAELQKFYYLLANKQYMKAYRLYRDMDTEVRESIPLHVEVALYDECWGK